MPSGKSFVLVFGEVQLVAPTFVSMSLVHKLRALLKDNSNSKDVPHPMFKSHTMEFNNVERSIMEVVVRPTVLSVNKLLSQEQADTRNKPKQCLPTLEYLILTNKHHFASKIC